MSNFKVSVYKQFFDFSAGHFITYGSRCETLHGHNYRVEVALFGENGSDGFVYNFSDLKPLVRQECKALDHLMLLAAHNPHLTYTYGEGEVEVRFGTRRYLFPQEEVILLPIENTTAELLAYYLLRQIRAGLSQQARVELEKLHRIEVMVEEQPGQAAFYAEEF
ncbi:MAG: 6-carboxytetrahydropterin synthase [Chloroflexota bacterium]